MPFRDPILAGNTLVREAIQSPNYVPGSAGWSINRDGSAEFANLAVRGSFRSAVPPQTPRIEITAADPSIGALGGEFLMFSTDTAEVSPGSITYSTGDLVLSTAEILASPVNRRSLLLIEHASVGIRGGLSLSVQGAPAGVGTPLVSLGDLDNAEVRCGSLVAPIMRAISSPVGGNVSTASTSFVALGSTSVTGTFPPSGVLKVGWGASMTNNAAAGGGYALMSMEIRSDNAAGTPRYAATSSVAAVQQATNILSSCSFEIVVSGLPTSGTFFARPLYLSVSAGTSSFDRNYLTVTPQP